MTYTAKLSLLIANKPDSTGDVFTTECLQKIAADFKTGQYLPVKTDFNHGDTLGLVKSLDLSEDGQELFATVELLDTRAGQAAATLVEAKQLELAAGGEFSHGDIEDHGGTRTIKRIRLNETALTGNKVKP